MRDTNALKAARDSETDPYRRRFTFPKWNRTVTVTDEPSLFARLPEFTGWTSQRHQNIAHEYAVLSTVEDKMHADIVKRAEAVWGSHGPLVSGIVRDHFHDAVKDALRHLAHSASDYLGKSLAHWKAAGFRQHTWRVMIDKAREDY